MDIDPKDLIEGAAKSALKEPRAWFNPAVAVTVALLATFMGICKVKDDNIVQAMQQAQADKLDYWQYYQARTIRMEISKSTLVQLRLQAIDASPQRLNALKTEIATYEALVNAEGVKREALKVQAETAQKTYDALNYRDDQFDLSDACLAIAIALLAIASLTQLPWLFALALIPSVSGFVMGLAGLAGWGFHPDTVIKLLS